MGINFSNRRQMFLAAGALQLGCGLVFFFDVVLEVYHGEMVSWIEVAGIIALALGAGLILNEYRGLLSRNQKIERELGAVSGAFQDTLNDHFEGWGLTAAERDVALLTIKGVPIADIAKMRDTRDGTIKAQSAAIYRKAGVSSRAELVAVAIEDVIAGLSRAD